MTDLARASIYVPITSITKADGGRTRIVTGVAASDRLDYDGQRASYEWLKKELTDWFKVGNMRQDHRPGGVGKGLSIEFDDEKHQAKVTSKAVDEDTVLKLDEQILNGYSWGAKSVPGNPIRVRKGADGVEWIESGKIVEVSYVDHPANPDCFVQLVKSAGGKRGGLRATKQLGTLDYAGVTIRQAGDPDFDAILKAMLSDIYKRDVGAAERERLGNRGHAVDTGQDHPSFPIATDQDLRNAIQAYGRANPEDRARVRAHIISEAKRLGRTDLIPDAWKSVAGISKQASCNCCDDCGPDCQGDCCDDCTMSKAVVPATIRDSVKQLAERETDEEYRAFLGKVGGAVEAWAREPGVSISSEDFFTLGSLAKAAGEPDLTKARTFYSQSNRVAVEQAMFNLHNALGLFLQGGPGADVDKDQRNDRLTGQDAPPTSDQPGGPGTAPGDGNPGDGNMAFDPEMVRDGDPAVRTPDGERDGRAQGEAGTHTWPPAGDAPGQGPGDKGKGEAPAGKGGQGDPQQAQQQAPDRSTPRGRDAPSKAAKAQKRLKKLEGQLDELRKAAQSPELDARLNKAMKKAKKQAKKESAKAVQAQASPLADALNQFSARIAALEKAAVPDASKTNFESTLLLADLQKAAYEQTRKDLDGAMSKMAKQVKRAERKLQKETAAQISAGTLPLKQSIDALGRLPAPGGPQIVRPQDKAFAVNDTIQRSASPELAKDLEVWQKLAASTDQVVAEGARQHLRALVQQHGLTG